MRALCGAVGGGLAMLFLAGVVLAQEEGATASATANPAETGLIDMNEIDRVDECIDAQVCIDRYLWSLYQRTRKVDTIRVPEEIKVAVKRRGKIRTVTKTVSKYVVEDFSWKDLDAAHKAGMSAADYVIGGMDRRFRVALYHALRMLDDAGLMPGITSAFRDDYRQTIASGQKAQSDRSYHGGSFRGGYGHGLAADIVSVKGETRAERLASSDVLWKWVDAHEKELGIGRPYLDRDAPHVGPLDGQEYFAHRVEPKLREAEKTHQAEKSHEARKSRQGETKRKGHQRLALHSERAGPRRAKLVRPGRAQFRAPRST